MTRKAIIADIIVTYFLLILGGATAFVSNLDPRGGPIGLILYLAILGMMFPFLRKPLFDMKSIVFFAVFGLWTAVHFVIDSDFEYFSYAIFGLYLVGAFLLARSFGYGILKRIVKIVCILSVISLFFWLVQIVIGVENLISIAPFRGRYSETSGTFLFFNALKEVEQEDYVVDIYRNPGFAWEPGRFASILVFAMVIQIITHGGRFSFKNRNNLILLVALITTFSTTGYVSFIILYLIHFFWGSRMKLRTRLAIIAGSLVLFGFVFTLPFMADKLVQRFNAESYITGGGNMQTTILEDHYVTVDRFEGILLDGLNFIHNPIAGYGLAHSDSFISKNINDMIETSNGLTKTFAKFGFFIALCIFASSFVSSLNIAEFYHYRIGWLFFVIVLLISVSYFFFDDPIVLSLTLYPVFRYDRNNQVLFFRRRKNR